MSYAGNWYGSGQIPARAVAAGLVTRFGSHRSRRRAATPRATRSGCSVPAAPHGDSSELDALAYAGPYRFNLFSNFTLFLRDPDNGDEIEQVDRRTSTAAGSATGSCTSSDGVSLDTTIGADGRSDDIHGELWNTLRRRQLAAVRDNDVHADAHRRVRRTRRSRPLRWLRARPRRARRPDLVRGRQPAASADPTAPTSGVGAAHQFSPKASLIVTPIDRPRAQLDVYVNYGHGFHSNDVRGVFAQPPVTPLTRAMGEELGARARLFERWDLAAAALAARISTTRRSGSATRGRPRSATRPTRKGIELETRYEITPLAGRGSRPHLHAVAVHASATRTAAAWRWRPSRPGRAACRRATRSARASRAPACASSASAIARRPTTACWSRQGSRGRPAARLPPPLVRPRARHREPARRSATARRSSRPPAGCANEPAVGAAVPAGFSCGPRAARARARRRPRERPLLRLRGRRLHAGVSPDRAPDGHPLPGLIVKMTFIVADSVCSGPRRRRAALRCDDARGDPHRHERLPRRRARADHRLQGLVDDDAHRRPRVAPGASSASQRTVPGDDFAYALLAPGWTPEVGGPRPR